MIRAIRQASAGHSLMMTRGRAYGGAGQRQKLGRGEIWKDVVEDVGGFYLRVMSLSG